MVSLKFKKIKNAGIQNTYQVLTHDFLKTTMNELISKKVFLRLLRLQKAHMANQATLLWPNPFVLSIVFIFCFALPLLSSNIFCALLHLRPPYEPYSGSIWRLLTTSPWNGHIKPVGAAGNFRRKNRELYNPRPISGAPSMIIDILLPSTRFVTKTANKPV